MKRVTLRFQLSCLLLFVLGSPLLAQKITVKSATPSSARQGSTLTVIVAGSGFAPGARVDFLVTGTTDPGGVVVNQAAFNSSSELSVNLTALEDAVVSSYDILVTNTNGRTGKGIEKFAVEQNLAYVTLRVTIEGGNNIGPDDVLEGCDTCGSSYIEGLDGVGGGVAVDGNLHFIFTTTPANGGEPTPRKVYFDFSALIEGDGTPPDAGLFSATQAKSSPALDPYGKAAWPGASDCAEGMNPILSGPLQRMSPDDCQIHQFGIGFFHWNPGLGKNADWPRWRLQFHRAESASDDSTSHVAITCRAEKIYAGENNPRCSEWVIEPVQQEVPPDQPQGSFYSAKLIRIDLIKGKQVITHIGYFNMPFKIFLEAEE